MIPAVITRGRSGAWHESAHTTELEVVSRRAPVIPQAFAHRDQVHLASGLPPRVPDPRAWTSAGRSGSRPDG